MVKVIWTLIGINALAVLVLIGAYFIGTLNRHASYEEKGWTTVLSLTMLFFILLAAIPLYYSRSTGTLVFSGIMAAFPGLLALIFSMLK